MSTMRVYFAQGTGQEPDLVAQQRAEIKRLREELEKCEQKFAAEPVFLESVEMEAKNEKGILGLWLVACVWKHPRLALAAFA